MRIDEVIAAPDYRVDGSERAAMRRPVSEVAAFIPRPTARHSTRTMYRARTLHWHGGRMV